MNLSVIDYQGTTVNLPPEFIAAATLGTQQSQSIDVSRHIRSSLAKLLAGQENPTDERQLLAATAGLDLQQKAGWIPPTAPHHTLPPAEPETLRLCSPHAIRHLILMLDGYYKDLLPEWLKEVASSQQRAPEEALPLLLDAGRKHKELRDLIFPVIGERGKWLGRQITTQRWDWFEAGNLDNIEKRWSRGADDTRVELIELLRKTEPDHARELVEATWKTEPDALRIRFVEAFHIGLSQSDEPFL